METTIMGLGAKQLKLRYHNTGKLKMGFPYYSNVFQVPSQPSSSSVS